MNETMLAEDKTTSSTHFDAIVVGASIAGSVCALELANKGWQVAVIEKRQSLDHYKRICTHIIHPSGVAHLKRLGIFETLANQSTLMTAMNIKHDHRSVFFPFGAKPAAANIERRDLDPVLKAALQEHQNIDYLPGSTVSALSQTKYKTSEVSITRDSNKSDTLSAAVVIGADGKGSNLVDLVNGTHKKSDNGRVALFSYFEQPLKGETAQESHVWSLNQGDEYIGYFPNKNHILISWYISAEKYQRFQADLPALHALFEQQADYTRRQGHELGERLSQIMTAKSTSPVSSRTKQPGVALVGDAKLAADPLTGVGCSWAMSSAKLLSDCLGPSPSSDQPVGSPIKHLALRLFVYNLSHFVRFLVPSTIMNIASAHGRCFFNKPVFRFSAWLTRKRP